MAFLTEILFPGGTQPSWKITEIPGDGGSKTKVPSVEVGAGVWKFV